MSERVSARFVSRVASVKDLWMGYRSRPPGSILAFNITNGVSPALSEFTSVLGKIGNHEPIHLIKLTRDHFQLACVAKGNLAAAGLDLKMEPAWTVNEFDKKIKVRATKSFSSNVNVRGCQIVVPSESTEIGDFQRAFAKAKDLIGGVEAVMVKHGFRVKSRVTFGISEVEATGTCLFLDSNNLLKTESDVARMSGLIVDLEKISVNTSALKSELELVAERFEKITQSEMKNKALLASLGIDHIEHNSGCTGFRCLTGHEFLIHPVPGTTLDINKILKSHNDLGIHFMEQDKPKIATLPNGAISISYDIDSSD